MFNLLERIMSSSIQSSSSDGELQDEEVMQELLAPAGSSRDTVEGENTTELEEQQELLEEQEEVEEVRHEPQLIPISSLNEPTICRGICRDSLTEEENHVHTLVRNISNSVNEDSFPASSSLGDSCGSHSVENEDVCSTVEVPCPCQELEEYFRQNTVRSLYYVKVLNYF